MFVELMQVGVARKLDEAEMEYYREPFKVPSSRKPVWRWPNQIPIAGEPADVTEVVTIYNQKLQESYDQDQRKPERQKHGSHCNSLFASKRCNHNLPPD